MLMTGFQGIIKLHNPLTEVRVTPIFLFSPLIYKTSPNQKLKETAPKKSSGQNVTNKS